MIANPFTYGNPISDPARFFGRQREVEQVFSRLRNAEAESSSLVGERRMGKTSLLKYLAHPDVRRDYRLDPDRYIFVYVDLQMIDPSTTPGRLWQRLVRQMALECQNDTIKQMLGDLHDPGTIDTFALADLFDTIDQQGQHIVLLLDEFENVTENANFGPDFFYGLRSLAIQHNLSLITCSRRELIELCHSEAIRSSPFFNIFANINLRLLSEDEARQLITNSTRKTGVHFTDQDVEMLLQIAGCHPFFLQAASHFLFDTYIQGLTPEGRNAGLIKEFREEAAPHLEYYWNSSNDHEKIVLTALALLARKVKIAKYSFSTDELHELYSHAGQTLSQLEKRGLVAPTADGYALINTTFGDWIIGEITDNAGDRRGYEEWLKSNQSIFDRLSGRAKSDISEILPKISDKYRELIIAWVSNPRNVVMIVGLLRSVVGFG